MGELLKPESDGTVKPARQGRFALVSDIHVVYPYAGDDACVQCARPLSKYNPHVICFVCRDKVRNEVWRSGDSALRDLLNQRRTRNKKCPPISKNLHTAFIEQGVTSGFRIGAHRPQNGHL